MDDKIEAWVQRAIELADLYGKASYQSLENHGELGDSFDEEQALRAHLRTTPEGYRLVPVEPTEAMLSAAGNAPAHGHPETASQSYGGIYRAMLAASQESGT